MYSNSVEFIGGKKMEIPQGWGLKKLSNEILLFKSGASISPYEFASDGIEVIPKKAISESTRFKVSAEDLQFVPPALVKKYRNAVITDACLVTALRDLVPTGPNIGRAVEIRDQLPRLMAQGTYAFTINSTIDHTFYAYVTNINYFRSQMRAIMVGSTQVHIRAGEYLNVPFLAPPLPQQQKIAKILTTVDNLIEQTQALIDKYTAIKQGMMADLFTRGLNITGSPETNPNYGKLRPSVEDAPELYKETELGWVPKEWENPRLSDGVFDFIDGDRGHNYPSQQDFFSGGHCLFLSAKNVTKRGFNWSDKVYITREKHESLNSGSLNVNDIVITTRGTVGNIALLSQMPEAEAVRVNSGMLILRSLSSKVLPEFAYYFLSEWGFDSQHQKLGSGSAQPQLPSKDLKQFLILIPSLREQERICLAIQKISRKLLSENKLINKLRLQKKGLMQDLLTGKVPVNA